MDKAIDFSIGRGRAMIPGIRLFLLIIIFNSAMGIHQLESAGGADVLGIKLAPRARALGSSGVSLKDQNVSPAYNPASLAFAQNTVVSFTHYFAYPDIAYEEGVFKKHMGPMGGLAGSILYRHQEPINNVSGLAPFYVSDTVIELFGGRMIDESLAAGIGVKAIIIKLGNDIAYTFAADIGVIYRLGSYLDIGCAVRNAGLPVKFINSADPLPLEANIGISRVLPIAGGKGFGRGICELTVNRDGKVGLGSGIEGGQEGVWALRAGYRYESGWNLAEGPTVGFGLSKDFQIFVLEVDYSWKLLTFDFAGHEQEHLLGINVIINKTKSVDSK